MGINIDAPKPYVAKNDCTRTEPARISKHKAPAELNVFGKCVANVVAHLNTVGTENKLNTTYTDSDFARFKAQEQVKVSKNMMSNGIFTK